MQEFSKILIVEDSQTQRIKLQLLLESEGYAVIAASNGREAIDYLNDDKHSLPDLVLSDIVMPEMDGIELTSEIRKNFENLPVIILTVKEDEDNLVKAFQAGAVDYLIKPFSRAKLIVRIKNTLGLFYKNLENFQIFNSAPIGMRLIDEDFTVTRVNDTMCSILGLKREDIIGKKCYEFYCANPDCQKQYKSTNFLQKGVHPCKGEVEYCRPDGTKVSGIVTHSLIYDKNGKVSGLVGSFNDVTEWKKTEMALQTLQNFRGIGFLAGGIAHDFNNILTGIYGNIELAKLKLPEGSESREYIEKSEQSLSRAKDLTNRLISFAHGETLEREVLDLVPIVTETLSFALSGSKMKQVFYAEDDLHQVKIDKNQIQRVLANLFVNSIEASNEEGNLYVYLKNRTIKENEFPDFEPGEYVEFILKDEGCGMSKEEISHAFTPYFSTKHTGRGFGLAICYSIIDKHNGIIDVESEPEHGTTFTILLPAIMDFADSDLLPQETSEIRETSVSENISVLIMDDEEMLLDLMTEFLKISNCTVQTSLNGDEAITYYKEAMESGNPFDIVILDLTIPGGMGGELVVKEILKMNPDAKCIVSSGYSENNIMANFSEYGFKDSIPKPYTLDKVRAVVAKVMQGD